MYKRQHMGKDAAKMQRINDFVLEIFHYFATYRYIPDDFADDFQDDFADDFVDDFSDDFQDDFADDFQDDFTDNFANDFPDGFPNDAFFNALGNDGQWFAKCCAKRKKLRNLLGELKRIPFPERGKLYEAMREDTSFQQYEGDDTFVFQESRLDPKLLRTAARLTSYLYDEVFVASGFQEDGVLFQYKEFKEQLCDANSPFLCPVCLNRRGSLKESGQIDHFFPKMKYPALTFRPENLTLICMECNASTGKGPENPMAGTDLTELYLPYVRGAEGEMDIVVQADGESGHTVKLLPGNSDPKTEKRIGNDDRIFRLTSRWNGQVDCSIERSMDHAREMNTAAEVESFLEEESLARKKDAGRFPDKLVEAACLEYLSGAGKKVFLRAWEMDRRDRGKML